jgi:hypothetical protein
MFSFLFLKNYLEGEITMKILTVYEARAKGRDFCQTEGSEHYKGGFEPFDLMIAKDIAEDFCIGSILKYAVRFKKTRNLNDLKKVSDYAHLLCGIELAKENIFLKHHPECKKSDRQTLQDIFMFPGKE